MAQLWGGRFTKETDQLVYNFNASISFDQKFYKQDIEGSMAHVTMLAKQGILTKQEKDDIIKTLKVILEEVESGKLEISSEYEDIHSFVEANLIDRLGETGKKLHTGRSRSDRAVRYECDGAGTILNYSVLSETVGKLRCCEAVAADWSKDITDHYNKKNRK